MAPPTGRVRPPVSATTPFGSNQTYGVVSPWRKSIAAITEKAQPTSTARPSRCRAPAMVSARAAAVAIPAPTATPITCAQPPKSTFVCPISDRSHRLTVANDAMASSESGRCCTELLSAEAA